MGKKLPIYGVSMAEYTPWYEAIPQEEVDAKFADNVRRMKEAEEFAADRKRPTHILGIAASPRSAKNAAAHRSTTDKALDLALELAGEYADVETEVLHLRDLNMTPCEGCYSTADNWCHYPCTCWPFDDMMDVYEAWTKADGVIIATPTHECNVSSHLKIMLDRLISLDGGAPFDPPPGWSKTAERAKAAEEQMKKNGLQYNPRLRKKAVTAIVFGHETGAQLAASAIMSSCHNRGMYNPPFGMVVYHLGGSGSPMIDPSTYSYSDGGKEIQEHIRAMVSNLVTYAKRDRELEVDFPDQNRT